LAVAVQVQGLVRALTGWIRFLVRLLPSVEVAAVLIQVRVALAVRVVALGVTVAQIRVVQARQVKVLTVVTNFPGAGLLAVAVGQDRPEKMAAALALEAMAATV